MTGNWSFVTPESFTNDRVRITGEHGQVEFSIFSFEPIAFSVPERPVLSYVETSRRAETITTSQPGHIQMPHIQSIVAELRGEGKCPSDGINAAVTSKAMDEILK
jgi:hypothetical protein